MTDEEHVLSVLKDGKAHSGDEIVQLSIAKRGHGLTVHSRMAGLRNKGWLIRSKKIPGRRDFAYWIIGRQEGGSVAPKKEDPVKGYIFRTHTDDKHNERVCKIVRRAEPDAETLEPSFIVVFSNGETLEAWGTELHPWYPS